MLEHCFQTPGCRWFKHNLDKLPKLFGLEQASKLLPKLYEHLGIGPLGESKVTSSPALEVPGQSLTKGGEVKNVSQLQHSV